MPVLRRSDIEELAGIVGALARDWPPSADFMRKQIVASRPEFESMAELVCAALAAGIPEQLRAADRREIGPAFNREVDRLRQQQDCAYQDARAAVEIWALALGVQVEAPMMRDRKLRLTWYERLRIRLQSVCGALGRMIRG